MELNEVLKQIRPCNMDESYIFISYSAKDQERVWRDVLKFQRMGYNVWLDEKNLDKTQASWRSDALSAIRDMNCCLMVFYVSRNSLVSQPCYSELACTVEDYTKAVHFGPVKFVAVDVEPINDIVEFSREVYMQIRTKDIPKAEKTTQAITLNSCIEQFFNSNNEKVRVKPIDLPNRKMDYYEEITAAFPDDTRIWEPVEAAAAEPAPAVIPEPAPAPEPVIIPEPTPEPVVIPEPAPAPEPVVIPEPAPEPVAPQSASERQQAAAKMPEELAMELNFSLADDIEQEGSTFYDLAIQAMEAANRVFTRDGKKCFARRAKLSGKQKSNALESFGTNLQRSDIVALLDPSTFGNGKEGLLLTESYLFSSWSPQLRLELFAVKEVTDGYSAGTLHILYRNGAGMDMRFDEYAAGVKALLQIYLDSSKEEIEANTDAQKQAMEAKKAAYWNEFGFGQTRRIRTEPLPTDPIQLANFALSEGNREIRARGASGTFLPAAKLTPKQRKGAVSSIAKGEKEEDILGMMDDTLFGSGKSGVVLTKTRLYSSWAKKHPIDVHHLIKIEQGKGSCHLLLTYDDYHQEDVFYNNDYLALKAILDVYLDAKLQK